MRSTSSLLPHFTGDLDWIHAQEGHVGKPYWPGGISGITLDPGADLGHVEPFLAGVYQAALTTQQWQAVQQAVGIKGQAAQRHLSSATTLSSIRITLEQAKTYFPLLVQTYWHVACTQLAGLDCAPAYVQTAVLSLTYNRGAYNPHLKPLASFIKKQDWIGLAKTVGAMQQHHSSPGIAQRRQREAQWILKHVP